MYIMKSRVHMAFAASAVSAFVSKAIENVVSRNVKRYGGPTKESNWIIPGHVLVGAYPLQPEKSRKRTRRDRDLEIILRHGITTFVCLQDEYRHAPFQMFTKCHPYIIDAWEMCKRDATLPNHQSLRLLHLPIRDCSCTSDRNVLKLCTHLAYLILRRPSEKIYIHCWGGHGRTGTVVAVLLGLLFGVSSEEALRRTQFYHDCRRARLEVPSPQTEQQVDQVKRILSSLEARKLARKLVFLRRKLQRRAMAGKFKEIPWQTSKFDLSVDPNSFNYTALRPTGQGLLHETPKHETKRPPEKPVKPAPPVKRQSRSARFTLPGRILVHSAPTFPRSRHLVQFFP